MSVATADQLRFGPFTISLRRRTLANAEGEVNLSSRAFDLLVALIQRRDEIVKKDELIQLVWNNLVVEENNLHVQIAAIRRALGEHHGCIKTIPGKGYRFIADLSEEHAAAPLPARSAATTALLGLPAELTALIGRRAELASLAALLAEVRQVTLVGPGGVGKTKLALGAARIAAAGFADGAALVELSSAPPGASVAAAIAAGLRVEELQGRTLEESIVAALRPRAMLLLLDGCEHVEAAALTAILLRECPGLRLLCTSQAPLGLAGEIIRRVAPLDVPEPAATAAAAAQSDAVCLFVERAAAGDGRFALNDATVESVVAICRALDGIPLAIELAAARVALLGLEPVRLRLGDRLARLGDPAGDRRRTLGAAIEWSFGLLAPPDRLVLRRLSVFASGFTLAAAREVAGAGLTGTEIEQGVENLVRRSLLTSPDPLSPRHRMLEVMRNFAFGALAEAGEQEETQRRHAGYFCRLAHAAEQSWESSEPAEWTAPFAVELDNLRAALSWALSPAGDPLVAARLAAATARVWFEGSHSREGEQWLARALAGAPPDLEAATLMQLKWGLASLGEGSTAVIQARDALALAVAERDIAAEGRCARQLASALTELGRYDEAEPAARRALECLRSTGQTRTLARCLSDLTVLSAVAGDYTAARRYNAEALARLRAVGDHAGAAICLQHAAEFDFADGDAEAAAALAEDSVSLLRPLNRRFDLQVSLGNLAAYRLAAGDYAAARTPAREALTIGQQIEDELGVVIAIEHLAMVAAGTGGRDVAARLLGHAEAARAALGLARQKTEETTHGLLLAALHDLTPARRESLALEGHYLPRRAAAAAALRV